MKTLYIAEKPELARAIADAISNNQEKKEGYIAVGESIITWCYGHLLELKEPKEYNTKYEKWDLNVLPFEIDNLEYKPIKDDKKFKIKQLEIIKKLIKETDLIVHAGDPDDEGQYLVDLVLKYSNNSKPVKRILINDNTKEAVKKSLANLKNNKDFQGYSNSAMFRNQADWKFGLNLTIAYTMASRKNGYNPNVLSIGRVQTPILYMIYTREQEVKNHVKELYYNLYSNNNFKYEIPKDRLENNLCKDKDYILLTEKLVRQKNDFKIFDIEIKNITQNPLLPFNLLELQAFAFKCFKYTPDQVKSITQNLREKHKAITYNRSDCQYLTDEHYAQRVDLVDVIFHNFPQYQNIKIDTSIKSKAFNNDNVSAHHGIIPTINKFNTSNLNAEEFNIYKLIVDRYLIQFMPNKIIEKTIYSAKNSENYIFKATTNKVLSLGWTEFYQNLEDENNEVEENSSIYSYQKGDLANFADFKVVENTTKPKQLYTFATLLKDLTNVAKYIKDPAMKQALIDKDKEKKGENGGIGTPATRDTIIKKLFDRDFIIEEKGKIITSDIGKKFLNCLPDNAKTPDMTALWSIKQEAIKKGTLNVKEVLAEIDKFVLEQINDIKEGKIVISQFNNTNNTRTNYAKSKTSYKKSSNNKK